MVQHLFSQPFRVQIQFFGHHAERDHGVLPVQPRPGVTAGRRPVFWVKHLTSQDVGGAKEHHGADASPATNQFVPRQRLKLLLYHLTQDFLILLTDLFGRAHLPTP